jgi:hypothetical protein
MKCAVEMGSGTMIYIPYFINIGSGIQKLIEEIYRHTDSIEIASVFFHFLKIKNSDLKTNIHSCLKRDSKSFSACKRSQIVCEILPL